MWLRCTKCSGPAWEGEKLIVCKGSLSLLSCIFQHLLWMNSWIKDVKKSGNKRSFFYWQLMADVVRENCFDTWRELKNKLIFIFINCYSISKCSGSKSSRNNKKVGVRFVIDLIFGPRSFSVSVMMRKCHEISATATQLQLRFFSHSLKNSTSRYILS